MILDATNPLSAYPNLDIRWDGTPSAGEELQEELPNAYIMKAFNTIGAEHMDHGDGSLINGQKLTMLVAGVWVCSLSVLSVHGGDL